MWKSRKAFRRIFGAIGVVGTGFLIAEKRRNTVYAATEKKTPQDFLLSEPNSYTLYFWVHLHPKAKLAKTASVAASFPDFAIGIRELYKEIGEKPDLKVAIGLGPRICNELRINTGIPEFTYEPSKTDPDLFSGGDLLICARSSSVSQLFDVAQFVSNKRGALSVKLFKDHIVFPNEDPLVKSFPFKHTENSTLQNSSSGGTFCFLQRWIDEKRLDLTRPFSTIKSDTGVYRTETMCYPHLSQQSGVYFAAYAASPEEFEELRQSLVEKEKADSNLGVRFVVENLWYFPPKEDLRRLIKVPKK